MSTTEKFQVIKNSSLAMKQAIIDKGGTINGDITTWANSITNIPSGGGDSSQLNFDGVPENYEFLCTQRIEKIIIKEGVKVIGDTSVGAYAFSQTWRASSVEIPNTVEIIGPTGFEFFYNLTHITLPNSVKNIYPYAFDNSYLETIIMPNALEYISAENSLSNSPLEFCYFNNAQFIPELGDYFYIIITGGDWEMFISSTAKIIVPDNLYDEWCNADGWSYLADQIYRASEYPLPTE